MENSTSAHQQIREALEPCPFCGGAAHFFKITDLDDRSFGGEGICCGSCPITTDLMFSLMDDCKPLLAEKWNRRAPRLEAAAVPSGYKTVMVPEDAPGDEPDFDECIRQAEVATGLKVERHTISIVIREVRRWLAHKHTYSPELSREDVVRLARKAGFEHNGFSEMIVRHSNGSWVGVGNELQRFASLVRSVPVGEVKPVAWQVQVSGSWLHCTEREAEVYAEHNKAPVRALYTTPPAPPEGWKLVPVEPTPEMRDAGAAYMNAPDGIVVKNAYDFFKSMLSAAPQPGDKN